MQKITDNVYVETEFRGANNGFVVTKEGVVMIDPPWLPVNAIKWRDEISQHGEVRYLINTEPHPDHIAGNYFFSGAVVAHEGTREAILTSSIEQFTEFLKEASPESLPLTQGFSYRPPAITFSERLTFYLGAHTFRLINLPGHSPFQVAVHIPEERVVFTSDNVMHKVQPWLREALPYDWLDSLGRIQELEADVLIPGHGSICDPSYIPEMSAVIQAWIDAVTAALERGMSLEEAQDTISFLDRYPVLAGTESRAQEVERANVARLYEVLKK